MVGGCDERGNRRREGEVVGTSVWEGAPVGKLETDEKAGSSRGVDVVLDEEASPVARPGRTSIKFPKEALSTLRKGGGGGGGGVAPEFEAIGGQGYVGQDCFVAAPDRRLGRWVGSLRGRLGEGKFVDG